MRSFQSINGTLKTVAKGNSYLFPNRTQKVERTHGDISKGAKEQTQKQGFYSKLGGFGSNTLSRANGLPAIGTSPLANVRELQDDEESLARARRQSVTSMSVALLPNIGGATTGGEIIAPAAEGIGELPTAEQSMINANVSEIRAPGAAD